MSFSGFWKNVGLGFAKVGKGAAKGALWASQHPEVLDAVAAISGHPEVIPAVNAASGVIGQINNALPKPPPLTYQELLDQGKVGKVNASVTNTSVPR